MATKEASGSVVQACLPHQLGEQLREHAEAEPKPEGRLWEPADHPGSDPWTIAPPVDVRQSR